MLNILFDFISLQGYHNGGEEFTRKILNGILEKNSVNVVALYDSKLKFLDEDYEKYSQRIGFVDIQCGTLEIIVKEYNINLFFIGIAQRYCKYNLDNINCRTICVIHDIGDIEITANNIQYLFKPNLKNNLLFLFDRLFPSSPLTSKHRTLKRYSHLQTFLYKKNVEIVTVSDYTKNSLQYYFPKLREKDVKVYYPPVKNYKIEDASENEIVKSVFDKKIKYLLFLNANRANKNFSLMERCFSTIEKDFPDFYLVVTNLTYSIKKKNIIGLTYVSNSDMENLYKNAWAIVYPSITEGFGYPPIEAMKYSTPIICSNVCSIPEIVGDAGVYFSPYYENDLYYKFKYLLNHYDFYKGILFMQYEKVKERQNEDSEKLICSIIT